MYISFLSTKSQTSCWRLSSVPSFVCVQRRVTKHKSHATKSTKPKLEGFSYSHILIIKEKEKLFCWWSAIYYELSASECELCQGFYSWCSFLCPVSFASLKQKRQVYLYFVLSQAVVTRKKILRWVLCQWEPVLIWKSWEDHLSTQNKKPGGNELSTFHHKACIIHTREATIDEAEQNEFLVARKNQNIRNQALWFPKYFLKALRSSMPSCICYSSKDEGKCFYRINKILSGRPDLVNI